MDNLTLTLQKCFNVWLTVCQSNGKTKQFIGGRITPSLYYTVSVFNDNNSFEFPLICQGTTTEGFFYEVLNKLLEFYGMWKTMAQIPQIITSYTGLFYCISFFNGNWREQFLNNTSYYSCLLNCFFLIPYHLEANFSKGSDWLPGSCSLTFKSGNVVLEKYALK